MSARDPRQAPPDYELDPLDDPDPFDPTGYYARKAKHRAEMIPYLAGLAVVAFVLVFVRILIQEKLMTPLIINGLFFAGGLIVGWNFLAQPAFVKTQVDKVRAKFRRS